MLTLFHLLPNLMHFNPTLYLKNERIFFTGIILFFFSISLSAQTIEKDTTELSYVRPSEKSKQKETIRLLKKEKRKAEKVTKNLKSKINGPNTSLSALEQDVVNKTDQRIDSLSKVINEKKGNKKGKSNEKVTGKGRVLKNEQLQKAEKEAVSNLKGTGEGKELQNKLKKEDLNIVDSSAIANNKYISTTGNLYQLKDLSTDSLKEVVQDTIKIRVKSEAKERATAEAMKIEGAGEAKEILDQVKGFKADSASADKIAETLANKTEYGKDLGKLNGQQDALSQAKEQSAGMGKEMKAMQDQAKALQDQEQMQRYAKEKAAKLANADFAKFAPQIQQAQQQFTQYKKKMEWVKEGSGKNANSLKDEPFGKRLIYGGNFQIPELDPFSVVAAPFVAYRINKKFSSGVSVSYKSIIGKNDLKSKSFGAEVGYRVFTDYKLIKNWFAHGEFERLSKVVKNIDRDGTHTTWQSNGYIGAGRQINAIKGLKINAMFLVNILHKDLKYFDPNAFQFRFGVSR
jgi:hypothetical protein